MHRRWCPCIHLDALTRVRGRPHSSHARERALRDAAGIEAATVLRRGRRHAGVALVHHCGLPRLDRPREPRPRPRGDPQRRPSSSRRTASRSTWRPPISARRARPSTCPSALGILAATGLVKPDRLDRALVMGELSLDGSVRAGSRRAPGRPARRREGFTPCVVPADNAAEATGSPASRHPRRRPSTTRSSFLNGEREIRPPPCGCRPMAGRRVGRRRRLRRRAGSRARQARARDRRRGRRTTCCMIGPPGAGKTHARPSPRRHPAAADAGRGDRGDHGLERGRAAAAGRGPASPRGRSARRITPPPTPA